MQRMTTDTPQTNMETLMNFAYAKDKEVHLTYGDGMEDVTLADYIVDHAKSDFECAVNREDVINGDSCWECDCPLAVLNAVATQAAELRAKLKKYEDAEEQGRLVVLPEPTPDIDFMRIFNLVMADGEGRTIILPCKLGDFLYAPTRNFVSKFRVTAFEYAGFSGEGGVWIKWGLYEGITGKFNIDGVRAREIGKTVFLTREEAEAALKGAKTDG